MTNYPFKDISDYRDLESINAYNNLVLSASGEKRIAKDDMLRYMALKSRDNSRTPMQWNTEPNAGFSTGEPGSCKEPWIAVNPNYRIINAEEQLSREDSVFRYYQKLIQLRKELDIITQGDFLLLMPEHSDLFVYMRRRNNKKLLVACNFVNEERIITLPEGFINKNVLISNDDASKVYTTIIDSYRYKHRADILLGAFGAVVLTN
jgi:oligo-1,6-glucosidase